MLSDLRSKITTGFSTKKLSYDGIENAVIESFYGIFPKSYETLTVRTYDHFLLTDDVNLI